MRTEFQNKAEAKIRKRGKAQFDKVAKALVDVGIKEEAVREFIHELIRFMSAIAGNFDEIFERLEKLDGKKRGAAGTVKRKKKKAV